MTRKLQWILGILAALGLFMSVVIKLINVFGGPIILGTTRGGALRFAAVCCLASIALSMIQLSSKSKGE